MSHVEVRIMDKVITGWTYATVIAGIERVPRTFELGVVTDIQNPLPNALNQPCEIYLQHDDGTPPDKVLTGYVDVIVDNLAEGQHEIVYTGRGICCDLVDSSSELYKVVNNEVIQMSVLQVAKLVCDVYDIPVKNENPQNATVPFNAPIGLSAGDSAFSAIELVARVTNCLLYEDGSGALVIGSVGSEEASATTLGHTDVTRSTLHFDTTTVYSDYWIWASNPRIDISAVPPGKAHDPTFDNRKTAINKKPRYRKLQRMENFVPNPLIYGIAEALNPQQIYAQYLCNRYNGRSQVLSLTVVDWRDKQKKLWVPNEIVSFYLPNQRLNNKTSGLSWVVSECKYSITPDGGTTTMLTLMPREAFTIEPISGPRADMATTAVETNSPVASNGAPVKGGVPLS